MRVTIQLLRLDGVRTPRQARSAPIAPLAASSVVRRLRRTTILISPKGYDRGVLKCRMRIDCENILPVTIGVAEIDAEHCALFTQLDRLIYSGAHPDSETFGDILGRIGRQLAAHFESEERLMAGSAMPSAMALAHQRAHTSILEQYAELNLDLTYKRPLTHEEVLLMIKQWIVEHIVTHDATIRDYIDATR